MKFFKEHIALIKKKCDEEAMKRRFRYLMISISKDLPLCTITELDFLVGYKTGLITKTADVGEINAEQKEQLIQYLQYSYEAERKKWSLE